MLAVTRAAAGADYYLDCAAGKNGSGTEITNPWNNVSAVNQATFAPGDILRLKRGSTCKGALWPKGSGRSDRPITLASYGSGPLPLIEGTGNQAAFQLHNQQYWEIKNIEIQGGNPYGIHIGGNAGELRHFRLTDVVVHDVSGEPKTKESGLIVIAPDLNSKATFHDVVVDGATVYHTSEWAGIIISGSSFNAASPPLHGSDVVVRNSLVHDVAGDAILIMLFKNALIERNVAWNSGMQPTQTIGTPNGIWEWMCEQCVVQYNEGFLTDSPGVDGGVFDIDYGNHDNIVQYNYGHDSQGYCISVFGAGGPIGNSTNSIVRYNVCLNNARSPRLAALQGAIFVYTWNQGYLDGTSIHNNTIFWNPPAHAAPLVNGAEFTGSRPNLFANNLIWSTTPELIRSNPGMKLDGNLYWYSGSGSPIWNYGPEVLHGWEQYRQKSGQDEHGVFANPRLTAELTPRPGSPVLRAAIRPDEFCMRDILGKEPGGRGCDMGALAQSPPRTADDRLAPSFRLDAAQGGAYGTEALSGQWAMVSFLSGEDSGPSKDARTQAVVLLSMLRQYQTKGLRVLAVAPSRGDQAAKDALVNRTYDWHLGPLPLLMDVNSVTAHAYGTAGRLSTFLISPQGRLVRHWTGLALSVDLDLTLRNLLGSPPGLPQVKLDSPPPTR